MPLPLVHPHRRLSPMCMASNTQGKCTEDLFQNEEGEICNEVQHIGLESDRIECQRSRAYDVPESFTHCEGFTRLEDGVQYVLKELVEMQLLRPESLDDGCMSALASLRSYQQEQVAS